MDLATHPAHGFGIAFRLRNIPCAFGGALLGTLIGVLPRPGPAARLAMRLPSIHTAEATPAPRIAAVVLPSIKKRRDAAFVAED